MTGRHVRPIEDGGLSYADFDSYSIDRVPGNAYTAKEQLGHTGHGKERRFGLFFARPASHDDDYIESLLSSHPVSTCFSFFIKEQHQVRTDFLPAPTEFSASRTFRETMVDC